MKQPKINELALLSDQNTCALLDQHGTICWYCPERFDKSAAMSSLLDERKGGFWSVEAEQKTYAGRSYVEASSVLETRFKVGDGYFTITDWLPLEGDLRGLCRLFSVIPTALINRIRLRGDYGQEDLDHTLVNPTTVSFPSLGLWLRTSHAIQQSGDTILFIVPAEEKGWAVLANSEVSFGSFSAEVLQISLDQTLAGWRSLMGETKYSGPYEEEIHRSKRAVKQLTFAPTGVVLAAASTSLPEVIGGKRNYDYRYVWTRDVSLIVSAFVQLDIDHKGARRVLTFFAEALAESGKGQLAPFYAVDKQIVSDMRKLKLDGYRYSAPVQVGNTASDQLQLDADGHVLLAAKLVYQQSGERVEWDTICKVADFLVANWDKDDNGIWEEKAKKAYTSSKVFVARGLEFMAEYSKEPHQAERWAAAAANIRAFIRDKCMTKTGAFAVYAGSQEVDVTSAMFPLWTYCDPDSPEMLATVREIESKWSKNDLYWRRLEEFDSTKEGAFLAGSCWMAHYYAVAGDLARSSRILDAVCQFQNDLGFFSEEAGLDPEQPLLGNFPQSFVHSSFVCAANGYKQEREGKDSRVS